MNKIVEFFNNKWLIGTMGALFLYGLIRKVF